jgi:hypothetical protein
VEKASICAYRAAVEPLWICPDGKPADPALARRMRPLVKRLFELTDKFQVPEWREGGPINAAKQRIRSLLGLSEKEDF